MKTLSRLHNYPRRDNMSFALKDRWGRAIPERVCQMDETVIAAHLFWGFTETDIVGDAIENIIGKTGRSEQQAIAELTKHNPQARFIQPIEVAQQVYYLAALAPSSISGQAIMIDGGETA